MSNKAIRWARKQRTENSTQKLVLLLLADHADDAGRAFPFQSTLAVDACCSCDTVQAALRGLQKLGLLTRTMRYNMRGKRTSNLYHLALNLDFAAKPRSTVQSAFTKPHLSDGDGGQIPPHIYNPHYETSRREALTKDGFQWQEESESEEASNVVLLRKRLSPLPEQWDLPPGFVEHARSKGLDEDAIKLEAESFRDFHLSKQTCSAHWLAEWRRWIQHRFTWQARQKATGAGPRASSVQEKKRPMTEHNWRASLGDFVRTGCWTGEDPRYPSYGPRPGQPGCLVPTRLLEEFHLHKFTDNSSSPMSLSGVTSGDVSRCIGDGSFAELAKDGK